MVYLFFRFLPCQVYETIKKKDKRPGKILMLLISLLSLTDNYYLGLQHVTWKQLFFNNSSIMPLDYDMI